MAQYIDGFVFPIARNRLTEYVVVAETVAEIYKEYGAIDYVEFVGDDMNRKCTRTFPDVLTAGENETIVFGWVVYESRASRDLVNEKVEADPRMVDLVAPLVDPTDPVFDSNRMAYGGFLPLVGANNSDRV